MTRAGAALVILALGIAGGAGLAAAGWRGYRLNMTPSYPLGLWHVVQAARPIAVGDRVFICLPPGAALELGHSRGYIGPGFCAGRTGPLIKTVAALGGQTIAVGRSVTVDGRPLPHSEIHAADAAGRPLARYAGGVVPTGRLYLHSDFAGSYDSRYFGPVPVSGLLGFAEPVLTFTP